MPGLNKQGPDGTGAMTGRQKGMCRRTEDQAAGGSGSGRGRGMGRGLGQGQSVPQGRRFDQTAETLQNRRDAGSDELKDLKEQYRVAQQALNMLEKKIAVLENRESGK